MAFSGFTTRSKSQDSPVLWLSFIAGSLVLHLAAILIGRWYFSQTASPPAGVAQAPLDFVEIDPNAPALKRPPASSNQATPTTPKVASPATPTEPSQSSSSIQSLSRQATPDRSSDRSTAEPQSNAGNRPNRSQPGQLPLGQTPAPRNPTARPTPNPIPDPVRTNPPQPSGSSVDGTSTSGSPNSQPQMETPNNSTAGNPGNSTPENPSTSTPGTPANSSTGDPNSPVASGTPLSISTNVRGEVYGGLSEQLYKPNEYARGTVRFKSPPKLAISFDYPSQLPTKVLDLQVGLRITREGQVVDTEVLETSPSLQQDSRLRESKVKNDIQSIVKNLILNANGDGSLAFDMNLDPNPDPRVPDPDAYRIMNIRVYIQQ